MSSKFTLTVVIFMLLCGYAQSQTVDCIKDFDFLVAKIRVDYPGYHDKVKKANKPQLDALEKSIRLKLQNSPDSCFYFFNEYTAFFRDRHLSVSYNRDDSAPRIAPAPDALMDVSTYGHNVFVNIDSLYNATKYSSGIEGVWSRYRGDFLVVKDGDRFVGILTTDGGYWKSGHVLMEFQPENDTVFNIIQYSRSKDAKPFTYKASLHMNGKILEQHYQTRYVRKSDSQVVDKTTLYTYIPQYPNGVNNFPVALALDDDTFLLRIPSFGNNTANELVEKHWAEISSRPNLIIDIRN